MATVTGTTAETALPEISRNWTVGCCAKAMAFWAVADGCWTMASCVAAPGVMVTVPEVAVVRPALVNCSVRAPMVPVIERPAKVARPFASVLMVAVPPSAPPPLAMATVTDRTRGTALPRASRTCTEGCVRNTTPLADVVEGCWTIVSCVAAPGVPVAVKVTGLGVMPPGVLLLRHGMMDAGATAICIFAPVSSPTIFPKELYLKTGFLLDQETLAQINGPNVIHLASGRAMPILEALTKPVRQQLASSPRKTWPNLGLFAKPKCRFSEINTASKCADGQSNKQRRRSKAPLLVPVPGVGSFSQATPSRFLFGSLMMC